MADVRKLLESLGLSQYSEIFERHDIDLAALIDTGEDDLKELGVSLGHGVLQRVYERMPEAVDSAEVRAAKALLEELRPAYGA